MNLLPFVMMILMILALFSLSQFQSGIIQKKERQIYLAYLQGLRKTRNDKVATYYKKTLGKKGATQKTSDQPPKQRSKAPKYFRDRQLGWSKGKLNLSSLLQKPCKYPTLEESSIEYMDALYGHLEFYSKRKGAGKEILDILVEAYKKEDHKTPFHSLSLSFEDKELQEIFYKIVRGTHTYDLQEKKGCPSLEEMFTFEPTARSPINYHYANQTFLECYLGEEFTKNFVALEKEKLKEAKIKYKSPISGRKFKEMVQSQLLGNKDQNVELFDFVHKTSDRRPARFQDPDTQITVVAP